MSETIRILVVDDELIVRESLVGWMKRGGHEVDGASGGRKALEMLNGAEYDLVFMDIRMPDLSGLEALQSIKALYPNTLVVMITAYASVETAIEAMKCGADDFLMKPFQAEQLELMIEKLLNQKKLLDENVSLRNQLHGGARYHDIIGASECMKRLFSFIDQVAGVDSPILLQGETGSGKELVAKAIHARSNRRYGPFIAINCGAFSDTLLESELFGHEAGSFTGASRTRKGRLEMARGGTLFLDEVGEIPLKMQVDLLRVLQEKIFNRVGGNRDITADFRLIAATHQDLATKVSREQFRKDFYFRLKVIEIEVPPLRKRKEDIPALAEHFLEKFRSETNKKTRGIKEDAMVLLQAYEWPGNVRELENTIERAVVLSKGAYLHREDFAFLLRGAPQEKDTAVTMRDVEKNHIEHILKLCRWNISKAAGVLEMNRVTLHHKIKKFALKPQD
ncbi:MAG: sigma-54 dependent transcriptional regulator [Syntrophobacteraceae bacterium]|nr:sigma-54 dependent transcriptional regulator [Syntrophobacteraceae bacterium]